MAELFRVFSVCLIGSCLFSSIQGQAPICMFQGYNADCRYRIDGISMVHITTTINHCNDPIDVSFKLESDNPSVVWHHTFSNDNEVQMVPGYDVSVQMQVLLSIIEGNKLWVKADFHVDGRGRAYFMDEKVDLKNIESCMQLNEAGKIALGCLIALLIIAGILLVVLVIIRRQRRLAEQHEDPIIEQMEVNEQANPVQESPRETSDQSSNNFSELTLPVVRFNLPTIPEQSESSSDSGHVSIELTNGHLPSHLNLNSQAGGLPI